MPVIDFQRYARRAQRDPAFGEALSTRDMSNLRQVIWAICHRAGYHEGPWLNATWAALRRVTGTPAPLPFSVGDIPALSAELRRLAGRSRCFWDAHREAETWFLAEVVRRGEEGNVIETIRALLLHAAQVEAQGVELALHKWDEQVVAKFADRIDDGTPRRGDGFMAEPAQGAKGGATA